MNISIKLLTPLSRQRNIVKKYNKTILRALASYTNSGTHVYQVSQIEQRMKYSVWAPNIVKAHEKEVPETLITDFLWSKTEEYSDLTAVVCGLTGRDLTYRKLRLLCKRLATSLLKEGFKPGDVIAMILPNIPEFPIISFGIMEAGLTLTTINPQYTTNEIAFQIRDSQAMAIFTVPEKLNSVLEVKSILEKENKEYGSKLKIICTNDELGIEQELPNDVVRFSQLISDSVDDSKLTSLQSRGISINDVTFLPYTGGATGKPKGVCLTHRNLVASLTALYERRLIEDSIVKGSLQEVVPLLLPAFHIYGFSAVLLQSFFAGAKVVTLPRFGENSFLKVLEKHKCSVLFVTPPTIIYMGTSLNVTEEHLKSLKIVLSAAAPIATSDFMKCIKKSPPSVMYMQGYGLTETSAATCVMQKGINKYDSVGNILVNTAIKVADVQTNQPLGPNEEGEICVKGPQVAKTYFNNEEATAEVFDSEGWLHTGDIGYYDNEKNFYITERLKEIIKVKGFQVAPAELEAHLRSHPEVLDAAVIGVPDTKKGETPIGFVKLKKGARVTKKGLIEFIAPKVAKYKQIDTIIFAESIPKNAAGKILRKEIKQNYLKKIDLEGFLGNKPAEDNKLSDEI